MKRYLLVLFTVLFTASTTLSQIENKEGNYASISKDLSSNTYTFSHELNYYEAFEDRLISEMNNNKIVLESLSIDNFRCEVVFIEALSVSECKENLSILVRKLNFDGFEIK